MLKTCADPSRQLHCAIDSESAESSTGKLGLLRIGSLKNEFQVVND